MRIQSSCLAFTFVAALVSAGGCGTSSSSNGDSTMLVSNESDFEIHEIFLTDVGSRDFGPNLLRGDVLLPGEQLVLAVSCGLYDAKLVDQTGAQCELHSVDLCFNNATWVLKNDTCAVFSGRTAGDKPAVEKATPAPKL